MLSDLPLSSVTSPPRSMPPWCTSSRFNHGGRERRGDISHSLSKSTSGPCLVSTPLTHHRVCFLLLVLCTVSRPSRSSWLFPCQSEHKLADSASWELYVRIFESTKNTHTEATRFLILIRSPPIPRTTPSPRSLAHLGHSPSIGLSPQLQ